MNIEQLYNFCNSKKGLTESFPFDADTLVFKVMDKIFLLTSLKSWEQGRAAVNLKCNPDKALELRAEYESIKPGYHMSKVHWNTIELYNGDISDDLLRELINHSYELIVKSLPKKAQAELENLE